MELLVAGYDGDETGAANLAGFQKLFDEYRKEILQSRLLMVAGEPCKIHTGPSAGETGARKRNFS